MTAHHTGCDFLCYAFELARASFAAEIIRVPILDILSSPKAMEYDTIANLTFTRGILIKFWYLKSHRMWSGLKLAYNMIRLFPHARLNSLFPFNIATKQEVNLCEVLACVKTAINTCLQIRLETKERLSYKWISSVNLSTHGAHLNCP